MHAEQRDGGGGQLREARMDRAADPGKRPAQTEGPSDAGGAEAHRQGVSVVREDGAGTDGRAQLLAAAGAEPVVSKAGGGRHV